VQRRVDADGRAERRAPVVANRGALPQTGRVNVGRERRAGVKMPRGENTIIALFSHEKRNAPLVFDKMNLEIAMMGY
jgi:hypothetical protein